MNIEYHKWFSPVLSKDMELKVYGHSGKGFLIFPTEKSRFYDWEDMEMIDSIKSFIEEGKIQLFTVDTLKDDIWNDSETSEKDKCSLYHAYEMYILNEVIPLMKFKNSTDKFATAGCGLGAYNALNHFLKHPDLFDSIIGLSGIYNLRKILGDYSDTCIYYNSPIEYLSLQEDTLYLNKIKTGKIILCTGQGVSEENQKEATKHIESIFAYKNIPAWIDYWGMDVEHEWQWWTKEINYYISSMMK